MYFRESLGIRDNESQLYLNRHIFVMLSLFLPRRILYFSILCPSLTESAVDRVDLADLDCSKKFAHMILNI